MNIKKIRVSGVDYDVEDAIARGMIASEYSTTTQYEENDFCIYEGSLCRATGSTTGTFNVEMWEVITVADMVENVSDTIIDSANKITYDNSVSGLEAINTQDAIDALANNVEQVNQNLGGLSFGTDGDGNYGYYGADGSLIPFKSINANLLYNVRATFVDSNNATLDLSFIKNYQELTVDDIYLYIRRGAEHESSTATTGQLSYTYDPTTGLVTVTSSIYYFRKEKNHIFNFLVAIKPNTVIKVVAKSRDINNSTITYDLSSYSKYKDLTGFELLWWMPYFTRATDGSARYVGRPWVDSYDADTGILVISDTEQEFPSELLATETTFFTC